MSPTLTLAGGSFSNNIAATGLPDVYTTPPLMMTPISGNLLFRWPTNEPGFSVELTTNLDPQFSWQPLGTPVSTNGPVMQQTATGVTGPAKFFRLFYSNP
jgi:hypothetical protein